MFGYVRPLRSELKCGTYDLYRAVYCGLCRTMRQRCGVLAPLALNYDFVFLALLLTGSEPMAVCRGRCSIPPFRRKCMCARSDAMETAADESVILTYWQLGDKAEDDSFFPALSARIAQVCFTPAYRRAAKRRCAFDNAVRVQLASLRRLEEENGSEIDPPADAFAVLLQAAAPGTGDAAIDRPMAQLLYHLGRWIYLIDARDDLAEDKKQGSYNPVALRYRDDERDDALKLTLNQSLSIMRAAAALLNFGSRTELMENFLNFGLPTVQSAVLTGRWRKSKHSRFGELKP